jgi:hypothetical protein
MYIMLQWCQIVFVDKIEKKRNFNFFSHHGILSRHAMRKMQSVTPQSKQKKMEKKCEFE